MDQDQAKFILQSFRPNGSDSQDESFAEALALAAADRELGEWLARERSQDAKFAEALAELEIPQELREDIIGVLHGEETTIDVTANDGALIGALAQIAPPADLRASILAGMEAEHRASSEKQTDNVVQVSFGKTARWIGSLAAAAMVVFAATLAFRSSGPEVNTPSIDPSLVAPITHESVQSASIDFFEKRLKKEGLARGPKKIQEVLSYLGDQSAHVPNTLPDMILTSPTMGCKVVNIEGKPASLICFKTDKFGVVHLMTFDRSDIVESPEFNVTFDKAGENCRDSQSFGITSWTDDEHAYYLFAPSVSSEELSKAF